ncbi:MAG: ASCH domain-containing protein [Gammaproteobacteria bacterium]|nr:ASCH domain-containing protein [Gammaproteobacteria bacterium]
MKVLLSIKPEYAEKILSGEKRYEFRRAVFKNPAIKKVVIYASSPVQKIVGEFDIEHILSLELEDLWKRTKKYSGIDKGFYDQYFEGKDLGHAIKVKKAKRYKSFLDLESFNIKYPPQSFMYL